MVSEFLVVLVLSLVFGNALLYFVSGKNSVSLGKQSSEPIKQMPVESPKFVSGFSGEEIRLLEAGLKAANERINLAHQRITELEDSLKSLDSVFSVKGKPVFSVEEKIRKLEDFRRETRIELQAIKKLLKQLKEFRRIKRKDSVSAKKEEELNKRIHALVFNTVKRN
jgi:DNA repair ATPase RecN